MTSLLPKIISVDDHVVEPPDVWTERLPKKFADTCPRVERRKVSTIRLTGGTHYDVEVVGDDEPGSWGDVWFYEGAPIYVQKRNTIIPKTAVADDGEVLSLDMSGMDLSPITFEEMLPSCYDPAERIIAMERNGVDGSLCFPTLPRFCGQTFLDGKDKELSELCVEAYNDWMVDSWCEGSDGNLIPLCIVPLWDAELAAAEVRRNAGRGVHAVAFSEIPAHLGLPSIHSGVWDPFFEVCAETATTVNMHIGSSSRMPATSADANPGVAGALTFVNSLSSLADFLYSGLFIRYPDLKIAYSEGGIGWIPYALEKADDFWRQHKAWTGSDKKVPEPPSTYYYTNVYCCTIRDPFGLEHINLIGEDNITFETDFPHTDTTWPRTQQYAADLLGGLDADVQYKILRGNAITMLSLDRV